MAKRNAVSFRTPVARMIGGNAYQGRTTDSKGRALEYKSGPKKGQARTDFPIGIAITKTQPHWATEPGWGETIWAEGHASWPGGQAQRPDFAWKVQDGDSTVPNLEGRRPCDNPGWPGHWVIWFSGTNPPPVADGRRIMEGVPAAWSTEPGLVMPGDYVEVFCSVVGNEAESPGVYLNCEALCLRGYHPEGRLTQRVDLASAGFGAPLPAGASAAPTGNALMPAAPPAPGASPSTPAAPPVPASPAPAPAASPVPVTPNPAILGAPAPVTVPPAPVPSPVTPPPAAPAKPVMNNGGDYDAHITAGWTDAMLREKGWIA